MTIKIISFFKNKFLLFYSLYFSAIFLKATSLIVDYPILNIFEKIIRVLSLFLLIIRIFILMYENKEKLMKYILNTKNIYKIILAILLLISLLINFFITFDIKLISLVIIGVASYGEDYKVIMKRMLFLQAILLMITIFCSITGVTRDYIILRSSGNLRHSLGFTYPSIMSQIILFIVLIYLYFNNYTINKCEFILFQVVNILSYLFTNSRTEFLIFELMMLFVLLNYKYNIIEKIMKKGKIAIYGFIILPIISLIFVLCYPLGGIISKIDSALSGRLMIQNQVLMEEGISIFGKDIEMVGYGLEDTTNHNLKVASKYNYIDNEYMQILIINGLIIYIFIIFIINYVLMKLYKENKKNEFILIYIYLLFATINSVLFGIIYSPVLIIIAYELYNKSYIEGR